MWAPIGACSWSLFWHSDVFLELNSTRLSIASPWDLNSTLLFAWPNHSLTVNAVITMNSGLTDTYSVHFYTATTSLYAQGLIALVALSLSSQHLLPTLNLQSLASNGFLEHMSMRLLFYSGFHVHGLFIPTRVSYHRVIKHWAEVCIFVTMNNVPMQESMLPCGALHTRPVIILCPPSYTFGEEWASLRTLIIRCTISYAYCTNWLCHISPFNFSLEQLKTADCLLPRWFLWSLLQPSYLLKHTLVNNEDDDVLTFVLLENIEAID